tara:strand:+ start:803 stop:1261 length:459 start_codon:yes stop_codon:yes gene_type:complete
MSGLNLVALQDTIAAHIRAEFPAYDVVEDEILDDDYLLKVNGKVKPYIVLRWGGLFRIGSGSSFAGVRFDQYNSAVDINVIAPTPSQARRAMNIITDRLIGWKPDGIASMIPEGGSGVYVVVNDNNKPHLYVGSSRLGFTVNGEDVGSYITP